MHAHLHVMWSSQLARSHLHVMWSSEPQRRGSTCALPAYLPRCRPHTARFALHSAARSNAATCAYARSTPSFETREEQRLQLGSSPPKTMSLAENALALVKTAFIAGQSVAQYRPSRHNRRSCAQAIIPKLLGRPDRPSSRPAPRATRKCPPASVRSDIRWSRPQCRGGMAQLQTWWC